MSFNIARERIFGQASFSFNVRSSSLDILLTTLGLGTVLILTLLYLIYLIVRVTRRKRPGFTKSKADRPTWVLAVVVAGSAWILSTLLYSGVVTIELESPMACSMIKFIGQYLLGWVLWAAAVNYKLIRKFYQLRLVKKEAPHALLAIILQVIPFAVLAGFEVYYARTVRDELDLCSIDYEWLIALYSMIAVLAVIFLFCFLKVRRTIGAHHEVIRYGIFMSTSLLFPVADAIVQFTPALAAEVWVGQALVILALLLILGNTAHIFVLVLKGRHRLAKNTTGILPPNQSTLRDATEVDSFSSLDSTEEGVNDQPPAVLDDINGLMSDGTVAPQLAAMPAMPSLLLNRPRRTAEEEMDPDFEKFVDNLPLELGEQIDRGRGYYLAKSRKRTRTVIEFDLDNAFRYLEDPADDNSDKNTD